MFELIEQLFQYLFSIVKIGEGICGREFFEFEVMHTPAQQIELLATVRVVCSVANIRYWIVPVLEQGRTELCERGNPESDRVRAILPSGRQHCRNRAAASTGPALTHYPRAM